MTLWPQLSPHFSGGENTTAGWHSGAASLVLRVLKREFGASNCQKEGAPCSMRDLGAVRSPHLRAKKPGNQAVPKMRGFLRFAPATQAEVRFGSNVYIGGRNVSHQTFDRHRGEFYL